MSKALLSVKYVAASPQIPTLAAISSMVTGSPPERYMQYCLGRPSLKSLIHWLVDHDWLPGSIHDMTEQYAEQFLMHRHQVRVHAALVVCRVKGGTHLLLWDGKRLWDPLRTPPSMGERPLQLREYHIRQVWPLTRLDGDIAPRGKGNCYGCMEGIPAEKVYWQESITERQHNHE